MSDELNLPPEPPAPELTEFERDQAAAEYSWEAQHKSLGQVLCEIAEAAEVPLLLPVGVVVGPMAKNFTVKVPPWNGWMVAAMYEKREFQVLSAFRSPKGVILPLYDWPDCRDREMLMAWRPEG